MQWYNLWLLILLTVMVTSYAGALDLDKEKAVVQKTDFALFGFVQLEVRGGDGVIGDLQDAAIRFGAQRVRLGAKYIVGRFRGKLFLDFNQPHNDKGGVGLSDMIKDAFVSYQIDQCTAIKFGLLKAPIGMSFTVPGWHLDIVERGFDKQLAFERDMGVMLSGRGIGYEGNKVNGLEMGHERAWKGFGYDLMIANQAGRSGAVIKAHPGDENAFIGRLMWDWTKLLHTEIAYGVSRKAGGPGTKDYKALNFGIDSQIGRGSRKLEIFRTKNIRGVSGWDENTYALTGTYDIVPKVRAVIKHIEGDAEKGGVSTRLGNTYVGFSYFVNPYATAAKHKHDMHRIQCNYVIATGDTEGKKVWNGLKGYRENAWIVQYEYKF